MTILLFQPSTRLQLTMKREASKITWRILTKLQHARQDNMNLQRLGNKLLYKRNKLMAFYQHKKGKNFIRNIHPR